MAPLGRAGTCFVAGLIGIVSVAALGGCTALVQFDDPPAGDDADDDDAGGASGHDAAASDASDATTVARLDASAGSDAADTGTRPVDAAPSLDAAIPDAAADGGNALLTACPTACESYNAGDFWVCGWKRAACIADPQDLNIVRCNESVAEDAYTCAAGETCLGSGNEDFCDPCHGTTGPMCDPDVKDPAHPAYLVNCMGTSAPTYQTCADVACNSCLGGTKMTTPP